MVKELHWFAAIAFLAFSPLGAQNPTSSPARTGKAQIVGVVVDSLNGRPLAGADILVEGAQVSVQSDSLGKFTIDSLAPGTYQVGAFHPLLDTLGLSLATPPFRVGPDSVSIAVLAVPSAATLVARSCGSSAISGAASAVIGVVQDPETAQPVDKAEVSIAWTQLEVSKEIGLRRTPRLLRDTTDATGHFRLCGLPSGLDANLQARRGRNATAELPVSLGERPVELAVRTVLLSPLDSTVKSGNASVSGTVTLADGASSAGTRVEAVGTDIVATTNASGEFTMRGLPSGTRLLLARHLGYVVETVPVNLTSHETQHVALTLPKFVPMMDPVLVTARRSAALDQVGFGQRSRGGTGYFLGPDRLKNMHPLYLTDILRQVPGLRVVHTPTGDRIVSLRSTGLSLNPRSGGGCVQFFVDDMPFTEFQPGEINSFVTGGEVVAVEVYQGMAPAEYTRGGGSCTTIVLWTRFRIRG